MAKRILDEAAASSTQHLQYCGVDVCEEMVAIAADRIKDYGEHEDAHAPSGMSLTAVF